MKKKDEQRLLQFPSVFSLEPGGRSQEKPVDQPGAPKWKREIARKVEEHRKMREHQENMERLQALEHDRDEPDSSAGPVSVDDAVPDGASVADETSPAEKDTARLEKLAETHRRLFSEESVPPPPPVEPLVTEPPTPPAAFDEVDLAKNPPLNGGVLAPVEESADESIDRSDYFAPLGELVERHERREATLPVHERADRTILVTRFLAGLVDFVIVLAVSALLVVVVSVTTGRSLFMPVMAWIFGLLFVLIHFSYSFYFLFLTGRTVGMHLVGLRVQGGDDRRLSPRAALVRTAAFMLSVCCLFLGLIWGIFDRQAQCWQDILSETNVTRVP